MFKFVIIEDELMISEMLAEFIEKTMPGYHCAGQAIRIDAGIKLCHRIRPGLVLIDIHLHGADGIVAAQSLTRELPETSIILISADCSPYNCYRIVQSGIRGFVDKTRPLAELKHAIKHVMTGESWFPDSFETLRREYGRDPNAFFKILSTREQEIMLHIVDDNTDEEIAKALGISPRTAETHRYNITKKLGLSDSSALRKYATEHGMWLPNKTGNPT